MQLAPALVKSHCERRSQWELQPPEGHTVKSNMLRRIERHPGNEDPVTSHFACDNFRVNDDRRLDLADNQQRSVRRPLGLHASQQTVRRPDLERQMVRWYIGRVVLVKQFHWPLVLLFLGDISHRIGASTVAFLCTKAWVGTFGIWSTTAI